MMPAADWAAGGPGGRVAGVCAARRFVAGPTWKQSDTEPSTRCKPPVNSAPVLSALNRGLRRRYAPPAAH